MKSEQGRFIKRPEDKICITHYVSRITHHDYETDGSFTRQEVKSEE